MFFIGDIIKIKIHLENGIIYEENLIISYINKKYIWTCGHCLPKNSEFNFGKIKYTSGFDNPKDSEEIGIIEVNDKWKKYFSNILFSKKVYIYNGIIKSNKSCFLKRGSEIINGKIVGYVLKKKDKGTIILNNWMINHQIDKLDPPYILIYSTSVNNQSGTNFNREINKFIPNNCKKKKIKNLTQSGFSGSPWLIECQNKIYHIGTHIGKTFGYLNHKKKCLTSEIAYVKPINIID